MAAMEEVAKEVARAVVVREAATVEVATEVAAVVMAGERGR